MEKNKQPFQVIKPNSFVVEEHWYPKALNATIHPMVNFFMNLSSERIVARYCHLHPTLNKEKLREILAYQCQYFHWSGADLINATTAEGDKKMLIIENNSCPSGQKSMPLLDDNKEAGTYRVMIERTFKPLIDKQRKKNKTEGILAVFYDKNYMEASGYAAVLADVYAEPVYLIEFYDRPNDHLELIDDLFYLKTENGQVPVTAAFRYVTQKPWNRIPVNCKTLLLNPMIVCLAGGRNKMLAAEAYDRYNKEIKDFGLAIHTPETIQDVKKEDIPKYIAQFSGQGVIKIPYSNAGQGVFTIVNEAELNAFMQLDMTYDKFIVQSLIGNYTWSSETQQGRFYHVGTIPNAKGETFVADIRLMVSSTENGIKPLCMYSRKALTPLLDNLKDSQNSWEMLGTNLSIKKGENKWDSDTNRLMIMDRRDYNKLGLGLDDLIETYIQTVLSTIAIDKMCIELMNSKGKFSLKKFSQINNDEALINEILI